MFRPKSIRNTFETGRPATFSSYMFQKPISTLFYMIVIFIVCFCSCILLPKVANSFGTGFGEIASRPAPVSRRECIGGANVEALCNEDADCPGSSCQDRNIYNVTVAVRFDANPAQLTAIQNAFTAGSELLFDVTDGQAQFGEVMIFNNSMGSQGHFWITNSGGCSTATGTWGSYSGGNINISMTNLQDPTIGPSCVAHEFSHLTFDVRDEYESRAVGCGDIIGSAQCPDTSQGTNSATEEPCLMECCARIGTEFCWGQAVGDNLAGGNHDATNVTEQSRCRNDRSCWEQVVWAWPETILIPAGAPDPGSNGLVHENLVFVQPPTDARLVLVLDRSGSMSSEIPTRWERLKTAALDVVDMAEDGIELGLVSFSDTATDEVAIAPLGADRSAYTNAINLISPSGATNIGDALEHAYNMIITAGGVTANTAIILMTDGRNNRPLFTHETHLQEKIMMLMDAEIPVYVTCTGDDLGLDSQCAEIAAGTGGTYVDSVEAAQLPNRFVSFYEIFRSRIPSTEEEDNLWNTSSDFTYPVKVESGANAVTFAVLFYDGQDSTYMNMKVTDPLGNDYVGKIIPKGYFVRVEYPIEGEWIVKLETYVPALVTSNPTSRQVSDGTFVVRSYIENQKIITPGVAQKPVVEPAKNMLICSRPLFETPLVGVVISGYALTPTGRKVENIILSDDGGISSNSGDEIADDGTYCFNFTDTEEPGAYTFYLTVVANNALQAQDTEPGTILVEQPPANFVRFLEISAVVNDTGVKKNHPPIADAGEDQTVDCTGPNGTSIIFDASNSYDPDDDTLSYIWTGPFGTLMGKVVQTELSLGTHTILLTVNDGTDKDTEGLVISVVDTTPPVIICPPDITAEQTSVDGTSVALGNPSVSDICSADPEVMNNAPAIFPLGETIVTWTAMDDSGNSFSCSQNVTVVDTTPPVIHNVSASPKDLWAPNHKMVSVNVTCVCEDICDIAPFCRIISVESNQPVNDLGDGNTDLDWEITGDLTIDLRAERSGTIKGDRIYTITVECTDFSGNSSIDAAEVSVKKPPRKRKNSKY